jgi:hypothetical protein
MMALRLRGAALSIALLQAACGSTATQPQSLTVPAASPAATPAVGGLPWPAPQDAMTLTRAAGLEPELKETLTFHVHAHLDVFVNGEAVPIPAGIGIDIHDPGVKTVSTSSGTSYGSISLCVNPCISPLHTHDPNGVIHTESATTKPNRLGQFFTEWGVKLDASCVGGYCSPVARILVVVDGHRYSGNPADIELTDLKEIAIVIGSAPAQVPATSGM